MSDSLSFTAYGGGSDNYYGTYGGTNQGPTSYNPWNIGGGGSSTYTSGPGVATPTGAADRVGGRVSPATQLRAVDKRGTHDIADGTAAQLLAQAQAIISVAASDNQDFAASNRAPNLYMPSVLNQTVSFESGQQFIDYLSRSAEPLIPNAVLGSTAQSVLGRPMSNEEIGALQGAVNAGGTLSTVRWSLAHSAEAVARITDIYKSVLDRDPDAPGLVQAEDALGGTMSLQDVRVAAAHSVEETNRINAIYQQVLGRAVDGGALNLLENATAGGWSP